MYTYDRYTPLNSNLILLIQGAGRPGRSLVWSFKFQSDSINTIFDGIYNVSKNVFKFQSDSINTTRMSLAMYFFSSFKFQSDSINTVYQYEEVRGSDNFKFQSDSINTNL